MGCFTSKVVEHPFSPIPSHVDPIIEHSNVPSVDPSADPVLPPTPIDANKRVSPTATPAISYQFQDIIDEKHMKYMDVYSRMSEPTEFWALGIENESYFMLQSLLKADTFKTLKPKRERYSVDYYKNFKPDVFEQTLQKLYQCPQLTYPVYINSHTFQKTDRALRHKTFYDAQSTPNPNFKESIHEVLLRECPFYSSVYDKSVVFDGDSIEFITQKFQNTTVNECMKEFTELKGNFQKYVFPFFERWKIGKVVFPDHNYGFVTFMTTNRSNLLVCNNGTIHINITLPTMLQDGLIMDKNRFAKEHLTLMKYIQVLEPLLIACYGTPDVCSVVDPAYSIGSLRITMSRYISLQTFDTTIPINGKLLVMDRPTTPEAWYNQFEDTPYLTPKDHIGFDMNFNKFKNHGIELRFFEWFPEEYLGDVINLIVLLAQHSLTQGIFDLDRSRYHSLIKLCVQKGFTHRFSIEECNLILSDLRLPLIESSDPSNIHTAFSLLSSISDQLFDRYHDSELVQKLSPNMARPVLVNYNRMAFDQLWNDVYGKPELVIRSELNPLEARTPLVPYDVMSLLPLYNIKVESSSTRCYSDNDYETAGATIVPAGYWKDSVHSYVIGLKAIDHCAQPTQTLLHFAHCFKGQEGAKDTISLLKDSTFVDYEYMVDRDQKRVISFCAQSGKIGCYLALMAYYNRQNDIAVLPAFDEDTYRLILSTMTIVERPRILLIGYGTAGKRAKEIIDQFGFVCDIWTSKTPHDRSLIFDYDILIHAIRLPDDPSFLIEPFLTLSELSSTEHRLSVICDITCDMGNPRNTLPIYTSYTTATDPIRRIEGNMDLIAINNLPSMEPHVSSTQFSAILSSYLPELPTMKYTHEINTNALSLYNSNLVFNRFKSI